jgi:hypothetical protein
VPILVLPAAIMPIMSSTSDAQSSNEPVLYEGDSGSGGNMSLGKVYTPSEDQIFVSYAAYGDTAGMSAVTVSA